MPLINYIGNRQECLDNRRRKGNAPPPIFLDYLVVGGGQYGDNVAGGGGGVVSGSIRFLPRFTLDVTVGDGGIGTTLIDAEASIIESTPNQFFVYAGPGYGNGTSGEPQNNLKGGGLTPDNSSQAGAGGSGQIGQNPPTTNQGGAGGSGSFWALDNTGSIFYAGGGGGYGAAVIASQAIGGTGGNGGGGNGEGYTTSPANGVNNLGGGGGGHRFSTNTNGGSGIVKMRYISGSVMGATGGTISVSGSFVYHTFTSSSQFVYQP